MFKPLTLILALLGNPGAAQSAKWEIIPESDPSRCNFRFSGWIQEGDLTGFVDTLRNTPRSGPNISICLDSEGGSTLEVLAFIEMMDQDLPSFTTRIERNGVCISACAILFMFGIGAGANSPFPSRDLEPGGRLGFHALFAAPDERELFSANEVFSIAMQAARLLADRSYRALTADGPALPQELLSLLFGEISDEIYFVDTVGELALLGIDIDRSIQEVVLPNSTTVFHDAVRRICASSHVLSNPQFFVQDGYRFTDLVEAVKRLEAWDFELHRLTRRQNEWGVDTIVAVATGPYSVPLWFSAGAELLCQVEFRIEEVAEDFQIRNYSVGFRRRFDPEELVDVSDRIFDWNDLQYHGMSVGLIPIDQRYE